MIFNEDCLDTMKRLKDKAVDVALTDPPYNVGLKYSEHDDNMQNYYDWCDKWFSELIRVSKAVYFTPGMKNINFWMQKKPVWTMCWFKSNQCSPSGLGGFNVWEPILVFGKPKKVGQDGFSMPIAMQNDVGDHPCPKNLKAWRKLLIMISNENDVVYDPFMGSGTTAISCIKENRQYLGSEIDKKYFELANRRIEKELSQGDLFKPAGSGRQKTEQTALFTKD